mgnify:CR=1 FL=1
MGTFQEAVDAEWHQLVADTRHQLERLLYLDAKPDKTPEEQAEPGRQLWLRYRG